MGTDHPYPGEVSPAVLHEILTLGEKIGWEEAIQKVAPGLHSEASDPVRAAFQDVLPLPAGSLILEVGAGLGATAAELAKRHRVVALEGVREQARLIAMRSRQQGLADLMVLHGAVHNPPLADGQFDAVVVASVLPWVGLYDVSAPPAQVQIRFLDRMRRLLRPGGLIYVGAENRFSLSSLRAPTDPGRLDYSGVVPRFLAYWLCARAAERSSLRNVGTRTCTHSYRGFERLFRRAGLRIDASWIAPHGHQMPAWLVPLEVRAIELYTRYRWYNPLPTRGGAFRNRLKLLCARERLWRYFGPAYAFLLKARDA
jgi:SAM-dependent methyltransferase